MSSARREGVRRELRRNAPRFAALGDETRLTLLTKLCGGSPLSIAQLTESATVTRQAVTKHLNVLQAAGLIRGVRQGRERRFQLEPRPLNDARRALENISRQWDVALARLKSYVEE